MANDGQIVFEVEIDGQHVKADIKEVTRMIQQESGKWDKAAKESSDSIGDSFTGMLKKLAAGFSAAKIGQALLNLGKDALQAASDLQEVQNVVDVTFGANSNQIETWAKNAGTQFGLTETQAKKFSSTMGAMLKSSGLAGDKIVDVSTDLAGLAADMASFYNLDFDEAFSKIRSGMSGMSMPLKELGIDMSVDTLNAFALAQGLEKTFNQMTQAEQTMLRYQYLMSTTADAQGDFARTSDGYANALRQLETNLTTLKTNLGGVLLTVVNPLINGINELFKDRSGEKTVLDDFADIDAETERKLAQIQTTAENARMLADELERVGGSKASNAGSNIQQMVEGLTSIDLNQNKANIVRDFLSTMSKNIDYLASVQGSSNEQAKAWLEGIAASASTLEESDVKGWQDLANVIKEGLPGLENTDFGSSFFSALGGGFSEVENKASLMKWAVANLGEKTDKTAEEQAYWLQVCKELVKTIPGLSSIINTETGEIKGGTKAVYDYIKAWEEGQEKLVLLGALEQKESALASRFSDLPDLQLDMALAERRVREQRKKIDALLKKYGRSGFDAYDESGRIKFNNPGVGLTDEDKEIYAALEAYNDLVDKQNEARESYNAQKTALEEAKIALEEYRQTIAEMGGDTKAIASETEKFFQNNADNIATLVDAADSAWKELADYAQGVRDSIESAIDSTTKGFEYIGNAADRQAKRLEPLEKELKNLQDEGKELGDINERISNAQDMFGIGNMTKNLESQLRFLNEYKADMEKAQELGFSADFLSQFADGSVESAEWLHELANASSDQVDDLNKLYGEVKQSKSDLADTLTDQQLAVDEVYQSLYQKAQTAIANLTELVSPAIQNSGEITEGVAEGIRKYLPDVSAAVDSILAQLARLSGYGITIDFGGFGEISFSTSSGKEADNSGRFGIDYVPHDDYLIRAHEGERLLTAQENQIWNSLLNGGTAGFDLETLGGVMRDNIQPGGNVYLDGKVVGSVISDRQGRSYKSLQRSGWQS